MRGGDRTPLPLHGSYGLACSHHAWPSIFPPVCSEERWKKNRFLKKCLLYKGQKISKGNFGVFSSPKKLSNVFSRFLPLRLFWFYHFLRTMVGKLLVFLEELKTPQFPSDIFWPFVWPQFWSWIYAVYIFVSTHFVTLIFFHMLRLNLVWAVKSKAYS